MKPFFFCAAAALLFLLSACGQSATAKESTSENRQESKNDSGKQSDSGGPNDSAGSNDSGSSNDSGRELVLANLNIKHGEDGLEKIAEAIQEVSPDFIGLEEVDVNCSRSGNVDEPKELARLAGYPYYAFAKAISLGDGEYGNALLSRYPIESFEVIQLASGIGEDRSLGHAIVSVEGVQLDVFVTHLSFEDRSLRIKQMKAIAKMLKDCDRYALLGDLNSFNIADISYLDAAYYVNREDRRYATFRRFNSSPDNIVVSEGFTELMSGVSEAECSDHSLLYAGFFLNGD